VPTSGNSGSSLVGQKTAASTIFRVLASQDVVGAQVPRGAVGEISGVDRRRRRAVEWRTARETDVRGANRCRRQDLNLHGP
jgi:hypothetical protein